MVFHFWKSTFTIDLRVAVPVVAALVASVALVTGLLQLRLGPSGVWNLDNDAAAIVCPTLGRCDPAEGLSVDGIAGWQECDNSVRRYFWVIFDALTLKDPDDSVEAPYMATPPPWPTRFPVSSFPVRAKCVVAPPLDRDFSDIEVFASKVRDESIVKPGDGSKAQIRPRTKAQMRARTATYHDAVLRVLSSLDATAQTETNLEITKLGANGSSHRATLRTLVDRMLCYRRRIGALKFLENAWFVGRLTDSAQWHLISCGGSPKASVAAPPSPGSSKS